MTKSSIVEKSAEQDRIRRQSQKEMQQCQNTEIGGSFNDYDP